MNLPATISASPLSYAPALAAGKVFLLVLFLFLGLWLILRYLQFQAERISQSWQRLATELDFAYKPAPGPVFRHKSEEVEGVIDGVKVRLTRYGLSPGFDSAIYTRWSADPDPKPTFVLYVHRRHSLSTLAKLLGYDDVETGDPGFDARFSVKSDDAGKVRELLTPEVRGKIEPLRSAAVVINEGGVNVVWSGPIVETTELKGGLDALRAVLKAMPRPAPKKPQTGETAGPGAPSGGEKRSQEPGSDGGASKAPAS